VSASRLARLTDAEPRDAADEAVATLCRSFSAGSGNVTWMMTDRDFVRLRDRPDSRLLALDMAFPTELFVAVF
jgi:hypothetical protein